VEACPLDRRLLHPKRRTEEGGYVHNAYGFSIFSGTAKTSSGRGGEGNPAGPKPRDIESMGEIIQSNALVAVWRVEEGGDQRSCAGRSDLWLSELDVKLAADRSSRALDGVELHLVVFRIEQPVDLRAASFHALGHRVFA
jgi:hypothetical protein